MSARLETGGCLCGATRFRVDDPPSRSFICHCNSCRRAAGGLQVAWVTVPVAQFHLEGEAPREHNSSPGVLRTFCGRCGTSLTWYHEGSAEIDVTLASFDQIEHFPPQDELWTTYRPGFSLADHRLRQWPEDYDSGDPS